MTTIHVVGVNGDSNAVPKWKRDVIATMTLSGTQVEIGFDADGPETSVFIKTPEETEPIYMSVCESHLLIAALSTACCQAEGKDRL